MYVKRATPEQQQAPAVFFDRCPSERRRGESQVPLRPGAPEDEFSREIRRIAGRAETVVQSPASAAQVIAGGHAFIVEGFPLQAAGKFRLQNPSRVGKGVRLVQSVEHLPASLDERGVGGGEDRLRLEAQRAQKVFFIVRPRRKNGELSSIMMSPIP